MSKASCWCQRYGASCWQLAPYLRNALFFSTFACQDALLRFGENFLNAAIVQKATN